MKEFATALTLALLAVPLTARQQPAQPPPTFRAATDIVEVDVVVQDKSGRFVADLKPEDFSVRDETRSCRLRPMGREKCRYRRHPLPCVGRASSSRSSTTST
jgi:hypothetical protein